MRDWWCNNEIREIKQRTNFYGQPKFLTVFHSCYKWWALPEFDQGMLCCSVYLSFSLFHIASYGLVLKIRRSCLGFFLWTFLWRLFQNLLFYILNKNLNSASTTCLFRRGLELATKARHSSLKWFPILFPYCFERNEEQNQFIRK